MKGGVGCDRLNALALCGMICQKTFASRQSEKMDMLIFQDPTLRSCKVDVVVAVNMRLSYAAPRFSREIKQQRNPALGIDGLLCPSFVMTRERHVGVKLC